MLIEREGPTVLDSYDAGLGWVERMKEKSATRGMLRVITEQLEERFGALPQTATARLEAMDTERLTTLSRRLLTADSLDELGLA